MPKPETPTKSDSKNPNAGYFFTKNSKIMLKDGMEFNGQAFGDVDAIVEGEFVFHTGMSGYQEVLTDPSYAGQIVVFTYPHIGNYGVSDKDYEAKKMHVRGVVVREYIDDYSNWRSSSSLSETLEEAGIFGISGVDTRQLTRHLREQGAAPGAMGMDETAVKKAAQSAKSTDGIDLVSTVSPKETSTHGNGKRTIVAMDFGMKQSIVDQLVKLGKVIVVPASTSADDILAHNPDGIFLSNGPGDPAAVSYAVDTIKQLLGKTPIFGICLGHQLLGLALGGHTKKLAFGHHGANHPVKDANTNTIEITSQNHNYELVADSMKNVEITHKNLNDGVVEGIRSTEYPAFSVQYHPESSPGPHDSRYLFKRFRELMDA